MKQHERRKLSSDRLINACLELASEQGVSALTFDNIGQKAGYSRNLAFQKFGSKGGLLDAVIQHLHAVMAERRHSQDVEHLSGLDGVLLYCDVHIAAQERKADMRAYFTLMGEAISEMSDMREQFAASHKRSASEIMRLIRLGLEDGSIREDVNVEMAAQLIGTQLIGFSIQSLVDPTFSLRRARKGLHELIVSAYGAQRAVEAFPAPRPAVAGS